MIPRVGIKVFEHSTVFYKILISELSFCEREETFLKNPMKVLTNNTITNRKILEKELEKVRKNGYAIDNEENEIGVT